MIPHDIFVMLPELSEDLQKGFWKSVYILPKHYRKRMRDPTLDHMLQSLYDLDHSKAWDTISYDDRAGVSDVMNRAITKYMIGNGNARIEDDQREVPSVMRDLLKGASKKSIAKNGARCVLTPSAGVFLKGTALPVGTIGVAIAMQLSKEVIIFVHQLDDNFLNLVINGPLKYPGASAIIASGRKYFLCEKCGWKPHFTLDEARRWILTKTSNTQLILVRHILDGDYVNFWRPPVNTPGSKICLQVKIVDYYTAGLPDLCLSLIDGDFDGDCVFASVDQDPRAAAASQKHHSLSALTAYATGGTAVTTSLDGFLGNKLIPETLEEKIFVDLLAALPMFSEKHLIAAGISVVNGRLSGSFTKTALFALCVLSTSYDANISKSDLSTDHRAVISAMKTKLPLDHVMEIVQNFQNLGSRYLMSRPLTVVAQDVMAVPEIYRFRNELTQLLNKFEFRASGDQRMTFANAVKSFVSLVIFKCVFGDWSRKTSLVSEHILTDKVLRQRCRYEGVDLQQATSKQLGALRDRFSDDPHLYALLDADLGDLGDKRSVCAALLAAISRRDEKEIRHLRTLFENVPLSSGRYFSEDIKHGVKLDSECIGLMLIGTPFQVVDSFRTSPDMRDSTDFRFLTDSTMGCDLDLGSRFLQLLKSNEGLAGSSKGHVSRMGENRNKIQAAQRNIFWKDDGFYGHLNERSLTRCFKCDLRLQQEQQCPRCNSQRRAAHYKLMGTELLPSGYFSDPTHSVRRRRAKESSKQMLFLDHLPTAHRKPTVASEISSSGGFETVRVFVTPYVQRALICVDRRSHLSYSRPFVEAQDEEERVVVESMVLGEAVASCGHIGARVQNEISISGKISYELSIECLSCKAPKALKKFKQTQTTSLQIVAPVVHVANDLDAYTNLFGLVPGDLLDRFRCCEVKKYHNLKRPPVSDLLSVISDRHPASLSVLNKAPGSVSAHRYF